MTEDQTNTNGGDDELEVTDLRPSGGQRTGGHAHVPHLFIQSWQRLILGLSLLLLVAVLLVNLLSGSGALRELSRTVASPTATPVAGPVRVAASPTSAGILLAPAAPPNQAGNLLVPTVVPNSSARR